MWGKERKSVNVVCVCGVYVWCEITKAGTRDMSRGEACAGRVLQRNQADHHIDIIIKKRNKISLEGNRLLLPFLVSFSNNQVRALIKRNKHT